ncbi:MAG: AAA family ATPase [Alphaproteobacteria bacterium]
MTDRPAHVVADQSEVAAFLSDAASHGDGIAEVGRIDTHGAMVFLAGDRVYKVKRAVSFPFMDFSSLERRRACCEREVALNRRTAPDLYLDAVAIRRQPGGGLGFTGDGEAVEWAVVMHRFGQADLLDARCDAGTLTVEEVRAAAAAAAALHATAEKCRPDAAPHAGAEGLRWVAEENRVEFAEHAALFAPGAVADYDTRVRAALDRHAALIDRRHADGLVRQCHGDLHLANIVLLDGKPVPFDCIEFNDALAQIDVLYDLAFLLMDLDRRGRRDLAWAALDAWLASGAIDRDANLAGVGLLSLFLSLRAAIRAKVRAAAAAMATDMAKASAMRAEAKAYFAAAVAYIDPPPARLLAVAGLSGTGKTTLARALAPLVGPAPGAVLVRSDTVRKDMAGVGEDVRLPASFYTALASRQVYGEMLRRARVALSAGHAVILDAVAARPLEREAYARLAAECGVGFDGLWLEAPKDLLVERVVGRVDDASDATPVVVSRQLMLETGEIAWPKVDATGSPAAVAERARKALGL